MPATAHQIAQLRACVARLEGAPTTGADVLPFGISAVDTALPGYGLKRGAMHEILEGSGAAQSHAAAATLFAGGIAARLGGPVLWITPQRDLFAPGLALVGLGPDRLLVAESGSARGVLPLVEEGLRAPALGAVVAEVRGVALATSRRLQLAAERSGVTLLLLRRWARSGEDEVPSAAATRWCVASAPSAPLATAGLGRAWLAVELKRCRGATAAEWILEAPDATGHCAMVTQLANRSVDAGVARRAA